jgi:hypothetical protein
MAKHEMEIDAQDICKQYTIKIKLKNSPTFKLWLLGKLLRVCRMISPFKFELTKEQTNV